MTLAEANLPGPVSLIEDDTKVEDAFVQKIKAFRFSEAGDLIFEHVAKGDEYMTTEEPYRKIKTEPEEAKKNIEKLVRHLAKIAAHLPSFMPETSEKILTAVRKNKKPENLFPRI
jgi:methionyl-tRNA synthetase